MKIEEFYYLSRTALVKDETNLDKFDQVFGHVFKGLEGLDGSIIAQIPEEWLKRSDREIPHRRGEEADREGGRLGQADGDAQGSASRSRRSATRRATRRSAPAAPRPIGDNGYNPEGVRIGQDKGRHGKAIKVWDKREYKNLDDTVELGTRNIKVALRRLRKWAPPGRRDRTGHARHDQGHGQQGLSRSSSGGRSGTTPSRCCCSSTSAARWTATSSSARSCSARRAPSSRHMEFFYFHNCLYESVWKDNRRRHAEKLATWDVLHKYPQGLQGDLRRRRDDEPL